MTAKTVTFKNEGDVKKHAKKLLTKHNWLWWMTQTSAYGKSGVSDTHALRDGAFMAIECKFGSNKPTENQKAFLHSADAAGALSFVVSDKNMAWFDIWLQAYDKAVEAESKKEKLADEDGAALINALNALTEEWR